MHFFSRAWHYIERKLIKKMVLTCGEDVTIPANIQLHGYNIFIGNHVLIGEGAVVAAGSLVTKDVAPYTLVGGVPAKKLKDRFAEQELQQHLEILRKDK